MNSAAAWEVLTLSELKRLQEVRNILELPSAIRIPMSISIDSSVGKELGIVEPIVAGFYKLRIEVLSGNRMIIAYRPNVFEYDKSIFITEIVYTGEDYEKVVREKIELLYANLYKVKADRTTATQYFTWVFGRIKKESPSEVKSCLSISTSEEKKE